MNNALFALSDLTTDFDGEPRIRDILIGERLGYDRPRDIRKNIEKNLAELESYGMCAKLARVVERENRGTIEVQEYWPNEAQCLLICMFARTDAAAEVRKALIDVFMAWRRGQLPPANDDAGGSASPETPAAAWDDLGRDDVRLALTMVRECRIIFGRPAARDLWRHLPLPQPLVTAEEAEAEAGGRMGACRAEVEAFLLDACYSVPGETVAKDTLYAVYVARTGQSAMDRAMFGKCMAAHGFVTVRTTDAAGRRSWAYRDIRLATDKGEE